MEEEEIRGEGWEGEDWAPFMYVLESWVGVLMPHEGVWTYEGTGNLEGLRAQLWGGISSWISEVSPHVS